MPEDTRFHPNMIILIPNNTKTVTHSREYYNMSIDNNHNESIQITLKFREVFIIHNLMIHNLSNLT